MNWCKGCEGLTLGRNTIWFRKLKNVRFEHRAKKKKDMTRATYIKNDTHFGNHFKFCNSLYVPKYYSYLNFSNLVLVTSPIANICPVKYSLHGTDLQKLNHVPTYFYVNHIILVQLVETESSRIQNFKSWNQMKSLWYQIINQGIISEAPKFE